MELIELQGNSVIKGKFDNADIKMFYQHVGPYPQIKELASKTMSMFVSTYVCEQLFSLMNFLSLDSDLNWRMRISTQR